MKVLFFIDRLRLGGIQTLAREILAHADPQQLDIEILNLDDGQDYPLTHQLRERGVVIHQLKGVWLRTPFDFPRYFKAVRAFFQAHHDYDVVHMHSSSKNYYILQCAAEFGIPVRVAHSHNTGFQTHNPLSIVLGNLMKRPLMRYATHCVGCSRLACQWLYGADSVDSGRAQVILNGIHSPEFIYKAEVRQQMRQQMQLDGHFVIGHVGRFEKQKNHTFLLDIFSEVVKLRPDALLLLIGVGSLQEQIRQKAAALGIADRVRFLGFRDDRNSIMQAMDSFLMPSLYEGLSVVLIEAQAAGLPVFVSDSTTRETAFSPYIQFLSLQQSAAQWAQAIVERGSVERRDMTADLVAAGFELQTMIDNLHKLYTTHK